jgi:FMN reductase
VAISFGPEPVAPGDPQPDAVAAVTGAKVLLVSTPAPIGTYTGLLKIFFERFPAGSLTGVLAVPVVVADSAPHVESTANDLARLLHELGADTPFTLGVRQEQLDGFFASAAEHVRRISRRLATAYE